jgi:hypothetical protein
MAGPSLGSPKAPASGLFLTCGSLAGSVAEKSRPAAIGLQRAEARQSAPLSMGDADDEAFPTTIRALPARFRCVVWTCAPRPAGLSATDGACYRGVGDILSVVTSPRVVGYNVN